MIPKTCIWGRRTCNWGKGITCICSKVTSNQSRLNCIWRQGNLYLGQENLRYSCRLSRPLRKSLSSLPSRASTSPYLYSTYSHSMHHMHAVSVFLSLTPHSYLLPLPLYPYHLPLTPHPYPLPLTFVPLSSSIVPHHSSFNPTHPKSPPQSHTPHPSSFIAYHYPLISHISPLTHVLKLN